MTTLYELKSILQNRGLHLNKKLGQHLLIDGNVREKIIRMADISADDFVIEIGPGMGFMTEEIVKRAGDVAAIEIDRGFVAYLHERFSETRNLKIIHQDILQSDLDAICEKAAKNRRKIKILGNLPYNINTLIIIKIAESKTPVNLCCFVVQKEVVDRYVSKPGTSQYGAITVYLNYRFNMQKGGSIPRKCFFPIPNVESAAITLIPHSTPPVRVLDEVLFFKIIRAAFGQRRKMLSNSLKQLDGYQEKADEMDLAFSRARISPNERPEKLSIEEFAALANALYSAVNQSI